MASKTNFLAAPEWKGKSVVSPTLAAMSVKKAMKSLEKGIFSKRFFSLLSIFSQIDHLAKEEENKPVSPTLKSLRSGSIKEVLLMIQDEVKGLAKKI